MSPRALLGLVVLTSCSRAVPDRMITATIEPARDPEGVVVATPEPPAEALDPRYAPLVEAAFGRHAAWGRVDDELRWAPFLCRLPMPARPHMSRAEGGDHAQKLYSLFARERGRYVGAASPTAPMPSFDRDLDAGAPPEPFVGQVVVKASYVPERAPAGEGEGEGSRAAPRVGTDGFAGGDHFDPVTTHGGATYRAGRVAGYYVIAEVPKDAPGADEGFVYGTLTADGRVTSAGRVVSCMACHADAKHGRLFGLAP